MFLRTILCMGEDILYRRVLMDRLRQFLLDPTEASENAHSSPLFDIFRVTVMFGMMNMVINMANNTHMYSKTCWKREVWVNAWKIENEEWDYTTALFADTYYLNSVIDDVRNHLVWWELSNMQPDCIRMCENVTALICRASDLKSDSIEFKGSLLSVRACECDAFCEENIEHIIMQCTKHDQMRRKLTRLIGDFDNENQTAIGQSEDILLYVLGKDIDGVNNDAKMAFWYETGQIISKVYEVTVRDRSGIG